MKTSVKLIALSAALMAMAMSCAQNEFSPEKVKSTPKVTMTINAAAPVTKTSIDASKAVTWSAGDQIAVFQTVKDSTYKTKVTSAALAADAAKASFSVTLDAVAGADDFKYIGVAPASAFEWSTDTTFRAFGDEFPYAANEVINDSTFMKDKLTEQFHSRFRVIIPRTQNPTADSWDPAADVLVSKVVASATQPESLDMEFHRLGTAVKMTIDGLTSGETIKYVDFSTTEAKICGRSHVNPITGSIYEVGYSAGGNVIHIIPATERTTTGSDAFWFRTLPGTLKDNFTVIVVTDAAYYVKTVDLKTAGRTIVFADEGLTTFSVSSLVRHTEVTDIDRTECVVTTSHPVFQEKAANSTIEFTQALVDNQPAAVGGNPASRFCMIRPGKGPVRTIDGTNLQVSKTETIWFQLDFGAPVTVSCFRAMFRPKSAGLQLRPAGFDEIQGSNDGAEWTCVAKDILIYNNQNVQETANIPIPPSTFRYYKFLMQEQKCFYQGKYISNGNTWQMLEFYLGN